MEYVISDFNGAGEVLEREFQQESASLLTALTDLPLHLKASLQRGRKGTPIFDPVGTNAFVMRHLSQSGWRRSVPMPAGLKVFGKALDLATRGLVGEVQFSNYPFLMNNVARIELLFKTRSVLAQGQVRAAVIVVKGRVLPASQSMLYYEQARGMLEKTAEQGIFSVPIRLVGLVVDEGEDLPCVWTKYSGRTSRTHRRQAERRCSIGLGAVAGGPCCITLS